MRTFCPRHNSSSYQPPSPGGRVGRNRGRANPGARDTRCDPLPPGARASQPTPGRLWTSALASPHQRDLSLDSPTLHSCISPLRRPQSSVSIANSRADVSVRASCVYRLPHRRPCSCFSFTRCFKFFFVGGFLLFWFSFGVLLMRSVLALTSLVRASCA